MPYNYVSHTVYLIGIYFIRHFPTTAFSKIHFLAAQISSLSSLSMRTAVGLGDFLDLVLILSVDSLADKCSNDYNSRLK